MTMASKLEMASAMDVSHAGILKMLGDLARELGQLERAERAYRDSLAQKADQPTIQFALGRLLLARYRDSCVEGGA